MHYSELGLVNTNNMLSTALKKGYAVPAFNFYNMETLQAILEASRITNSPIILAVSESALKYMTEDILMGMISGAQYKIGKIALHLDHGHSVEICKHAIDIGFSSVMFDGSNLSLEKNIELSKKVIQYAHKFDVSVETELGILHGIEDENTASDYSSYTNPDIVKGFVKETKTDSLAIAIGTAHGAFKRQTDSAKLRFDILQQIAKNIPHTPLVLHGASSIPNQFVSKINKFGGNIQHAKGIPSVQLRKAIMGHITKINVDSDSRLAFTSAVREQLYKNKKSFDPRDFLQIAKESITANCVNEIRTIMKSGK